MTDFAVDGRVDDILGDAGGAPENVAAPIPAAAENGDVDPIGMLVEQLAGIERMRAYLDAMTLSITDLLAEHTQAAAVERLRADREEEGRDEPGPASVEHARSAARGALADEISLITGRRINDARTVVEFAASPRTRTGPLREALVAGDVAWERARTVWSAASDLSDGAVAAISLACLASTRTNPVAPWPTFRRRLTKQIAARTPLDQRRKKAVQGRRVVLDCWGDGQAELTFIGTAEALIGAHERLDTLARALKRSGDPRTLANLRHDIGLGLMLYGQPTRPAANESDADAVAGSDRRDDSAGQGATNPWSGTTLRGADTTPASDATATIPAGATTLSRRSGDGRAATSCAPAGHATTGFDTPAAAPAGPTAEEQAEEFAASFDAAFPACPLPGATITVIVSAASLLGVNDDPGEVPGHDWLAAQTVRDIALARGSTWRRIVTDPVTGYAMAATSPSYSPPPRMSEAVKDRDATCRFPGCTHPAAKSDLDHVNEHPAGTTSGDNLQSLHRRHHSRKTNKLWHAKMSPDGTVTWTTPLGRTRITTPFDYRTDFGDPDPGPPPF